MWPFRKKPDDEVLGGRVAQPSDPLGIPVDLSDTGTSPIVSVSVGTTGKNRSRKYFLRMSKMECDQRIQSMLVYDCNQVSINGLLTDARNDGVARKIIAPEYLPFSEGFLRRVDQYLQHHGAIERDMEKMAEQMVHRALVADTEPQVFLEWVGYGGHAHLSRMMHKIVSECYRESMVLPVICFPDDRSMHRNIRDHELWQKTLAAFVDNDGNPYPILLSDNRRGTDVVKLDESLVTALASVEACHNFTDGSSSLAETISEFKNMGCKDQACGHPECQEERCAWLVVESGVIPVIEERALVQEGVRRARNGASEDDVSRKAIGSIAQMVKKRIWDIAKPHNRFEKSAFFTPGTNNSEQRIYVVLPYQEKYVTQIRDDIEDQLKREQFKEQFPGTKIGYAPGIPGWESRPENWQYVHISKIVGLPKYPLPASITSILNDEPLPAEPRSPESDGFVINDERQTPPPAGDVPGEAGQPPAEGEETVE